MKHFGVSAFISVLLIAVFGGFVSPEKTFAFNPNDPSKEAVLQWTSNKFGEKITAINNEISSGASRHGGQGSAEYATFVETANATRVAVINARTIFENTFLAAEGTDRLASLVYGEALKAASQSLASQRASNPILQRTYASNFIDLFSAELSQESTEKTAISQIRDGQTVSESAQNAAAATKGAANPPKPPAKCEIWSWTITGCIDAGLTWFVKNILLQFVGFFLWIAANLLNYAMYHGVFEFKKFAPETIYSIWIVVRQTVSLFVFFAGLFVGFMAVIGKSEDFKKYIAFLVVFGLFVNFSYPIVRVFVDISNVVSLQIYDTTLGAGVLAPEVGQTETAGGRIIAKMGLQNLILSAEKPNQGSSTSFTDQITSLPGALAAVGFVGYAAYIFFMAAFLIIARTALLVCIIIASPILLVDTFVPALGEQAQKLRGIFISQLFVAPVFTIMLALTLKFLDVFQTAAVNSVTIFFNLIIMITMLHIMIKVTKSVSGGVGEFVTKWAGKAGGLGVGLGAGVTMAGLGFAGRQTIGRAGEKLGEQGGLVGDLGRKMSSGKYDLRNLGATQATASMLGVYGMGKGVDKSRKEAEEQRNEEALKVARGLSEDEGNLYLKRKLSGARSGAEYRNFTSNDDDMMKQYINADEKERQKMRDDEKNKRFGQRFGDVDRYDKTTSSQEKQQIEAALGAEAKKAFDLKASRNNDVLEAYIKATDKERARMMADDKNAPLRARMEQVDAYASTPDRTIKDAIKLAASKEDREALEKRDAKDAAAAVRNADRIAGYLTADQATRESIHANALQANDQVLLDQLAEMEKMRTTAPGQISQAQVDKLNDTALAEKVLANDLARKAAENAKEVQATQAKAVQDAQLQAAQAIQQAQTSSAKAFQEQAQAAQETNAAVATLASSVSSLADRTDDLHNTLRDLVNAK